MDDNLQSYSTLCIYCAKQYQYQKYLWYVAEWL